IAEQVALHVGVAITQAHQAGSQLLLRGLQPAESVVGAETPQLLLPRMGVEYLGQLAPTRHANFVHSTVSATVPLGEVGLLLTRGVYQGTESKVLPCHSVTRGPARWS